MLAKCGFVFLVLYVYTAFSASINGKQPERVIVDLDAGIDDYQALTFLLLADKRRDIKISAIVLTDGNTALKDVKVNVLRLLEIMNVKHIPIYAGSATTMMHLKKLDNHFGSDGFGDLKLKKTPNLNVISKIIAPTAIADMVKLRPNKYSYIALGPMTNLALAMTMYEHVAQDLGNIFVMGGDYLGEGPEFNFLADPESAKIVLDLAKNITLFTWQACLNKEITIGWRMSMEDKIRLNKKNPVWVLNDMAERHLFGKWDHQLGYQSCDPILVFLMFNPEYITSKTTHKAKVEVCGEDRAKVILDENAKDDEKTVTIYHGFDAPAYENYFIREFEDACNVYRCDSSWLN